MMGEPETDAAAPAHRKLLFPLLALAIGATASFVLFAFIKENVENEARLRFERQASDAKHVIEARITSYFDVLYGMRALFSKWGSISRAEFHQYVAALDLAHRYPGFQGLNYAEYVTRQDKARFEARVRADKSLDKK